MTLHLLHVLNNQRCELSLHQTSKIRVKLEANSKNITSLFTSTYAAHVSKMLQHTYGILFDIQVNKRTICGNENICFNSLLNVTSLTGLCE